MSLGTSNLGKLGRCSARYAKFDDRVLVRQSLSGDAWAFEALVLKHQEKLHRIALRITNDHHSAEDIVQETLIRAFGSLHSFEGRSSFATWITRITINVAYSHRDRLSRRANGSSASEAALEFTASQVPNPEEEVMRRDVMRTIEWALTTLTERERAVFVLRDLEGLDVMAIARSLGIGSSGVKIGRYRACRKLRKFLSSHNIVPLA